MKYSLLFIIFVLITISCVYAQPITMKLTTEGAWILDGNQKVFFYQKLPKSIHRGDATFS